MCFFGLKIGQCVIVRQNEFVTRREQLLPQLFQHLLRQLLFAFSFDSRILNRGSQKHCFLLSRIDLILFFIDEVDSHAHIVVYIDGVALVELDARVVVLACAIVSVKSVSEKFWFNGHLREGVSEFVSRMNAIWVGLL